MNTDIYYKELVVDGEHCGKIELQLLSKHNICHFYSISADYVCMMSYSSSKEAGRRDNKNLYTDFISKIYTQLFVMIFTILQILWRFKNNFSLNLKDSSHP